MTHSVIIFRSKEYRFRVVAEYVVEGLRTGARVTAVLDRKTLEILTEILGYFEFSGDSQNLRLLSAEDLFLYRAAEWKNTLAELRRVIFSGETENGPGGIRTVFDMTYFLSSQRNYDRVLDFEGEFHELLRSYNADALCAYFYEYIPDFFYDKLSGVHSSLRVDPSVFRSPSLLEKTDPFSTRRVEEAIGQLLYSALLPRNFRRGETGEVSEGDTPCLFALIPDICLAVDPEMNIAYATPNCSNTLGYRQEELEGRKLNCLFPRNDFLLLEEKIRAGGPASAVLFGRHKDGEPSPLLITIRDITAGAMTAGHLVVLKPLEGTPLEDMPKATDRPGDRLAEKLDSDIIGEREFAVIRGVLQGKQNKEIATELNLAEITIKKQLSEIYRKLHVRNRMELIKLIQRIE